jgi:putative nucleotidyltransferase with HDIG domain
MSAALDLAEGRSPGHAQRVAFIAMSVAAALNLDATERMAVCYGALLHDLGSVAASAGLASYVVGDERLVFATLPLLTPEEAAVGSSETPERVVERLIGHAIHGARAAQELSLPSETIKGIASHHEQWDGSGYPHGLKGGEIPLIGRIVALADQLEARIDQTTPLLARRNLAYWLNTLSGTEADPDMVDTLRDISGGDNFWLGLFSADLSLEIANLCSRLRETRGMRLVPVAETMAKLNDSRFSFTVGVSGKVGDLAEALGRAAGLSDQRLKLLYVAALLHDVGQLSVSERIMAKPGILSVEELDVMRMHPLYSRDIVAGIHGLEEVADWVAAHHERVDGKGYPDGRIGDEIPMEARILAIADAYVSMTSDRPHRERAEPADAQRRLRSAGGTQLDADLVDVFLREVVA